MTRLGFGGARVDLLAQALASPGSSLYWNGTDGKPVRQNKRQYVSKMSSGGRHNFSLKARRFVSVGQSVCWESCWDFPRVEASAYPVYQWVLSGVHTHLGNSLFLSASPDFTSTCTIVLYAWPAAAAVTQTQSAVALLWFGWMLSVWAVGVRRLNVC